MPIRRKITPDNSSDTEAGSIIGSDHSSSGVSVTGEAPPAPKSYQFCVVHVDSPLVVKIDVPTGVVVGVEGAAELAEYLRRYFGSIPLPMTVEMLQVDDADLGDDGVALLLSTLSELRCLVKNVSFRGNSLTDQGAATVAQFLTRHIAPVHCVDLRENSITREGLWCLTCAVVGSPSYPIGPPAWLDVRGNPGALGLEDGDYQVAASAAQRLRPMGPLALCSAEGCTRTTCRSGAVLHLCTAVPQAEAEDQEAVPDDVRLIKTKLCKFFEQGACHRKQFCTFAHGEKELRSGATGRVSRRPPGLTRDAEVVKQH